MTQYRAAQSTSTIARTFLIADVRGYTRFTAERGDAAAGMLASRFADLARDAVEARGGEVIELRGDEALAVFASPTAAVRAAVEFQATCAEESVADPGFPLPVGIGIDAGEAVPVEDGFRGIALNMAARLCAHAGAGQILVSRTVAEQAGTCGVRFTERGPATFKGFDAPIDVVEATDDGAPNAVDAVDRSAVPPLPVELDVLNPLAGREHEMRWLRGTWRQVRRGRGRLVVVSGPPLMGKRRLAAELAAHVQSDAGIVRYAGPGGTAAATALNALRESITTRAPTLLVLDDLDVLGDTVVAQLEASADELSGRPTLVVALVRDAMATSALAALVERVDTEGDGHRGLRPLDDAAAGEIVRMYAGERTEEAPLESMIRASRGIPGTLHEIASDWAREEATRRLAAAAGFLAAGRERHAADLEFANNVIGLKLARLYDDGPSGLTVESCPYKGLAPFDAEDSALFFGRERLVGELAARTVETGLLGVVGASGSGKSSLLGAGLVPSLAAGLLPGSERWTSVMMRPGEHPAAAVRAALDREIAEDGRLVIVVDQFEEAFTVCAEEAERSDFVTAIVEAADRPQQCVVILAIRGDYYAHCAAYPALAQALASNHVLVGALSRTELRRAIELPARRTGLRLEGALVDDLIEEVAEEPGGLPFLSTALVELWQHREAGWIRAETLAATGGVRGAVARLAEASYAQLSEVEQDAARRVLLRLVATGEGDSATRRRVQLSEFDLDRDVAAAGTLARLTQDRLLTMSDDTVEVAHEALLREWPRLREWLDDDVQGRVLRQHLRQSAKQWQARDREVSELYRGARLSATVDWAAGHGNELNALEQEFLAASRWERERESERQRRTNRRLRSLLVGATILLVVALVAGSLAVVQRSHASRSATRAERNATTALANSLGAQAVAEPRIDLAMLLAREAVALDPTLQTRSNLLQTLLRAPSALRTFHFNGNRNSSLAVSPQGNVLVNEDNDWHVVAESTANGRVLARMNGHIIGFAGTGQLLTEPSANEPFAAHPQVSLRDPATLRVLRTFDVPRRWHSIHGFVDLIASGSGSTVLVLLSTHHDTPTGPVTDTAAVRSLDIATGRFSSHGLTVPPDAGGSAPAVLAMPGGSKVIEVLPTESVLYDVGTGARLTTYPVGTGTDTGAAALSPDGRVLAVENDTGLHFYDLPTRHDAVGVGASAERFMRFTPDSRTLITAGDQAQAVLWDVASHRARGTLAGHAGPIHALAVTRDGRSLYTGSFDTNVVAWDLSGQRGAQPSFAALPTDPSFGSPSISPSPDGRALAIGSSSGDVAFWDPVTERRLSVWHLVPGDISAVSYSRDGRELLIASNVQKPQHHFLRVTLQAYSVTGARPRLVRTFPTSQMVFSSWAAWSPDGRTIALSGALAGQLQRPNQPGMLAEWDATTGHLLAPPMILSGGYPDYLTFAHRGRTVAVGTANLGAEVVDPVTRRVVRMQESAAQYTFATAFSPDDSTVAAGLWDGTVRLYDPRTGKQLAPTIPDPSQSVINSLAYSPDGRTLAVTDAANVLRLFDIASRQQVGPPFHLAPQDASYSPYAVFSPDGSRVFVTGADAHTYDIPVSTAALEDEACTIANRSFTRAEWARYVPGRRYEPGCPAG